MAKVGVKFCGGCNPAIDRKEIFQAIYLAAGNLTFTGCQVDGLSALLFICGCSTACPYEESGQRGDARALLIAGEAVDGLPVPEAAIARVVAERLQILAGRLPAGDSSILKKE